MNFLLYNMFIINIFKSNIYKLLNRLSIERKRMKNSGSTKVLSWSQKLGNWVKIETV